MSHTCTSGNGSCGTCPECQRLRGLVQTRNPQMPRVLVCGHCDGVALVQSILRGKGEQS